MSEVSFGIKAEFPLGTYSGHREDGSPDFLPDPARLHAALLNAAAQGPRALVDGAGRLTPRPGDVAALEWLEKNPPSGIEVPVCATVAPPSIVAYRKEGVLRKEGKPSVWKDKTTRRAVSDRTALGGTIGWTWEDVPTEVRSSIEKLLPDVGCLGEGDSPVVLRSASVQPTVLLDEKATAFTPARTNIRVSAPGRTRALIKAHEQFNGKPPTKSKDQHKSSEEATPSETVTDGLSSARYAFPAPEFPDAPWTQVLVVPIRWPEGQGDAQIGRADRVRWAVSLHRALIKRIGFGASAMVTGVYEGDQPRPANRLAIQYIHRSFTTHHLDGVPSDAFVLMVPQGADTQELAQLHEGVLKLRSVRCRGRTTYLDPQESQVIPGAHFWKPQSPDTARLWHTDPAAVPETRSQRRDCNAAWTLVDAALLSLAMVWRDEVKGELGRARGTQRYELMKSAVEARGAFVARAHAIASSRAHDYVHKAPEHLVVQPYRATIGSLGSLGGPQTLIAIGQSRHLGGGLLVPVDVPIDLLDEDGGVLL